MPIYSKKGDRGETSLCSGERVPKYHMRVKAYGELDELQAAIGLARSFSEDEDLKALLYAIESQLIPVMGDIASSPAMSQIATSIITEESVSDLEELIDKYTDEIPKMTSFEIPGSNPAEAALHLARTVCRRAERVLWELAANNISTEEAVGDKVVREPPEVSEDLLSWVNRLSDLLFTLARYCKAKNS